MSAPGSPGGVDAAMAQLFGDVKAFSAMCNMRMLEKDDSEKMSAMMDFELLDGKMRVEVDLTKMKAKDRAFKKDVNALSNKSAKDFAAAVEEWSKEKK